VPTGLTDLRGPMAEEAKMKSRARSGFVLLAGDLAVYLVATLVGFAGYDELRGENVGRFLVTLLSFVLGWALLALLLNLYSLAQARDRKQLWRPYLAAVFSAPLGGWFRGLWLATPLQPAFILVMAAVASGLVLVWRMGYLFLDRRRSP
jgi:TM2 domain-containing membrane protein YozV